MTTAGLRIVAAGIGLVAFTSHAAAAARPADFNGDGRADLAIGTPNERVSGQDGAGGVNVIYGKNSSGLNSQGNQFWSKDSSGINGSATAFEEFGQVLASGDFDGDGFSDLAIGIPNQVVSGNDNAGAVSVIYGSDDGLSSAGDQVWHRNVAGVDGSAQGDGEFGRALTSGDFNNDGFDDLAIGSPGQNENLEPFAGVVHVLYGSAAGLTGINSTILSEGGDADEFEFFGLELSAGDYDGNGRDDLAVGVAEEDTGGQDKAGAVFVFTAQANGLDQAFAEGFAQGTNGVEGAPEANDNFGQSLASGDFDNNGRDDLAIGVPGQTVDTVGFAGQVHVIYGAAGGLDAANEDVWTQNVNGIDDDAGVADLFGSAMAAGDFDANGKDDLAIGVLAEEIDGPNNVGAVHVLYGNSGGLTTTGAQFWTQDSTNVLDASENFDVFGSALIAGDYDNDGLDDLAVAAFGESFNGMNFAGVVHVLYGKDDDGLASDGNQVWHQNTDSIAESSAGGDQFGESLR